MSPTTRLRLARIHRWIALVLSPVLVLILLSGLVLAFRPIVGRNEPPPATGRVDPSRVIALLDSLDPRGQARFAFLDPSRRTLAIASGPGAPRFHDVATGRVVAAPAEVRRPPDVFDVAERVHRNLWIGAEVLVTLASVGMLVLVILGPVMSRPRAGRSALAWHIRAGWVLWPLVALAPVSLVMMKVHAPLVISASRAYVAPARAIEQAARLTDLSQLVGVQSLPGAALIVTVTPSGPRRFALKDSALHPFDSRISTLGRELHEGTWAGPWSGMLNAIAAVVTLVMLGTGWRSWLRRRAASSRAVVPEVAPRAA